MRNFSGTVRSHTLKGDLEKAAPMHFGAAKKELLGFQEKTLMNIKQENQDQSELAS